MIHLIWHGRGWVVPASAFGLSLISEIVTRSVTGSETYYQDHGLPLGLALLISAAVTYAVYRKTILVTRDEDGRVLGSKSPEWIDHSFFFISISIWPIILFFCFIITIRILGI